ncbi:hypothetical protein MO767_27280 [Pseudomonas sp. UYIF39]|uniref:hypothetical protein n=1 Tax=Pseudomonas sp. UYIF39 TaxID=1630747 RepID=UPI00249EBF6A|nr:hypothetical protein [Pseudomonas sp. UYIF39]MDI3358018.1 hypothetical protein [Pseudomonas sp. UYIF39]
MLALEKIISTIRMLLFTLGCAGFHTAWISLLIVYFFELDVFAARVVVVTSFVVVSAYCVKIIPKELRKLEGE